MLETYSFSTEVLLQLKLLPNDWFHLFPSFLSIAFQIVILSVFVDLCVQVSFFFILVIFYHLLRSLNISYNHWVYQVVFKNFEAQSITPMFFNTISYFVIFHKLAYEISLVIALLNLKWTYPIHSIKKCYLQPTFYLALNTSINFCL